jgi:uncharacterized protein DUF222
MDPNTHSTQPATGLDRLAAVVDQLATEDLDALPDAEAARRVLVLRRLLERREGHWLRELAGVDGRGAAGADHGTPAEATAGWLRNRTRMGHPDAHQRLRVARALHRGPLPGTAQALADGEIAYAHAAALTRATQHLPVATTAAAEPLLLDAARRLDPPRLRKVVGRLGEVADPRPPTCRRCGATTAAACGWRRPWRAWSPSTGCWTPRPARPCSPPWSRSPAPAPPRMSAAPRSDARMR